MQKGDIVDITLKGVVIAVGNEETKDGKFEVASVIPNGPVPSAFTIRKPIVVPTPPPIPTPETP